MFHVNWFLLITVDRKQKKLHVAGILIHTKIDLLSKSFNHADTICSHCELIKRKFLSFFKNHHLNKIIISLVLNG